MPTTGSQAALLHGSWAAVGISLLVFGLRIIAKYRIHKIRSDDYVMAAAVILLVASAAMVTVAVHYGFGLSVPSATSVQAQMYFTLFQVFCIPATALARVSFILYMLGIVFSRRSRIVYWTFAVLQLLVNSISVILILAQCPNIQGVWDSAEAHGCLPAHIQQDWGTAQTTFNSFTDMYLAVFPIWKIWHIHLRLRTKISLIVLLSLGIFAMGASIARTVELNRVYDSRSSVPNLVPLVRWTLVECCLVVVAASLPCMRSLTISFGQKIITISHFPWFGRSAQPVAMSESFQQPRWPAMPDGQPSLDESRSTAAVYTADIPSPIESNPPFQLASNHTSAIV
ncbi:hypothetical protein ASPZODRAFT_96773 [Penicilliopsis zonata CBS 506.65]|uniref:Rhodopsin domain-containing protein n=1 Tax=Penicilliopsis zonata CBS 506.65 TaxID=1073090 RepID=A0A1L9SH32_9EURO|nr:hypothetical protein ASPZODRAFT_96773 [Penicilliopsis zonata CBS 506.65]OJJ46502.1 hypothetical protein ASPZODRAFT_96773 [Penicilliopsis zonata CBS 506.65]